MSSLNDRDAGWVGAVATATVRARAGASLRLQGAVRENAGASGRETRHLFDGWRSDARFRRLFGLALDKWAPNRGESRPWRVRTPVRSVRSGGLNRTRIVTELRRDGRGQPRRWSRRRTMLSRSTISTIVAHLLDDGLVVSNLGRRGRAL